MHLACAVRARTYIYFKSADQMPNRSLSFPFFFLPIFFSFFASCSFSVPLDHIVTDIPL
jgi:hypothetical protein